MEQSQVIVIIINSIILVSLLGLSFLTIRQLKLGSKNNILLFILFTIYWMTPIMCREYTGQMHIAMFREQDQGSLFWIPLTVYGIAGLFYRPLTDILSYKMKSRKNLIFISLGIQFATMLPMFIVQTFATNIIQSIGAGIGASIIGLFTLMFSEDNYERKVFKVVSIMALPPLIAELFTGTFKSIICSFLPEQNEIFENPSWYLNVMKYIWLLSIVLIVTSIFMTILIKEDKKIIFRNLNLKETVKTRYDWTVVILVAFVALCLGFLRWITAGPTTVTQFVFLGEIGTLNNSVIPTIDPPITAPTKYLEGYLSVLFAFGQMLGVTVATIVLDKHQKHAKWILVSCGGLLYVLYLVINTIESPIFLNAYIYMFTNFINGIAYGFIFVVAIGIMLNKHFNKVNIITPIGLFNTCLAGGITAASAFNGVIKGSIFEMYSGWDMDKFAHANHLTNSTSGIIATVLVIAFVIAFCLHTKYPPKKINFGKKYNLVYEMEI